MKQVKKKWVNRCNWWKWRLRRIVDGCVFSSGIRKITLRACCHITCKELENLQRLEVLHKIPIYISGSLKVVHWITLSDTGRAGDSKSMLTVRSQILRHLSIPGICTLYQTAFICRHSLPNPPQRCPSFKVPTVRNIAVLGSQNFAFTDNQILTFYWCSNFFLEKVGLWSDLLH